MKELINIQQSLVAKKDKHNTFGGYDYRSAEGILESLKPHLKEQGCFVILSDKVEVRGERYYVVATATLYNADGKSVCATAEAREEETKKGMDAAQITGAASSYARKYALCGLFAIDDGVDPDATNTHGKEPQSLASAVAKANQPKPKAQPKEVTKEQAKALMRLSADGAQLLGNWNTYKDKYGKDPDFIAVKDEMKQKLGL